MEDAAQLINAPPDAYPFHRKNAVTAHVSEAWDHLRTNGLVRPAPGMNGQHGYLVLTRTGEEAAASDEAFERIRAAKAFPKTLLHPTIADAVWSVLFRGHLDDAVFKSFKAVEEAVRSAGGYAAEDIGVDLMRKAFHPERGPLTKKSDPVAEREALSALFAGAIGSYKNPHSHRTVKINDPREAQEQVMLATHLLRIVDARRPNL
jgi:uncharacterized protein (TIGR02391 family)